MRLRLAKMTRLAFSTPELAEAFNVPLDQVVQRRGELARRGWWHLVPETVRRPPPWRGDSGEHQLPRPSRPARRLPLRTSRTAPTLQAVRQRRSGDAPARHARSRL